MRRTSRIHEGLTGKRALVGTPYLASPALRAEYEAEIAPRTEAAVARVLAALRPSRPVRRALDLGAGTGAGARAIRACLGDGVEVVAVDRVPGPEIQIVADVRTLPRPAGVMGHFDLVLAAHVLNELAPELDVEARAFLVAGWCRELLSDEGHLIVLEPALRETSRDLLAIRDRLIARGLFIVAPCVTQAPCPALASERDWCHDAAPAPGAPRVDFSYLVVAARGDDDAEPGRFRIVSDPMKDKGRLRVIGCGSAGRRELLRLDRDRAAPNVALGDAARGDVVTIGGAVADRGRVRIASTTSIALARAPRP